MMLNAFCLSNKLAIQPAGTLAFGQTFCRAEFPVLADSVEKLIFR
jgi:hypothetical protein